MSSDIDELRSYPLSLINSSTRWPKSRSPRPASGAFVGQNTTQDLYIRRCAYARSRGMVLFAPAESWMEFFGEAFCLKAKIQRERVKFVQNELALAFTLLDFAKVTQQPETRERSVSDARKAYSEVARLLAGEFDCPQRDRAHLESSLSRLKVRLDEERVTPVST